MSSSEPYPEAQPFFFDGSRGRLFCVSYESAAVVPPRGAVLFLPPFAEELNKARRMIALQARELARLGYPVLVPDMYGTGDSAGDFAEADWTTWVQDLMLLRGWLEARHGCKQSLWSLRTGALLGAALTGAGATAPDTWILWSPVLRGQQFLTQFLRLRLAAELAGGRAAGLDSQALRKQLQAGGSIEIAGYELTAGLAAALDASELSAEALARASRVGWFEVGGGAEPSLPPPAARILDALRSRGGAPHAGVVSGEAFWTTPETTVVPGLLRATTEFVARREPSTQAA
jgi:exosortase A-associated hydrolase 2